MAHGANVGGWRFGYENPYSRTQRSRGEAIGSDQRTAGLPGRNGCSAGLCSQVRGFMSDTPDRRFTPFEAVEAVLKRFHLPPSFPSRAVG